MVECRVQPYPIPTARMGETNPLADIKNVAYLHSTIEVLEQVPEEAARHINQGMLKTLLPYCQQDAYDRELTERIYQAIVLENDHLQAVFLPELGGRLWSLVDKHTGRELLYRNPVVQPGNLALRNAWCSGGVEFNMSIKGHNPLTCDDVFARRITVEGTPGVRFYEYERVRGIAYVIDAWLPEDSRYLYIRPRLENRTGGTIWQYWWSNIAVPQEPGTRVIVPAGKAFENFYSGDHYVLGYTDIPEVRGIDVSYPERVPICYDYFFDIPRENAKWITSLGADGYGLVQCSTRELKGRKLFLWGALPGGDNWSDYLCHGRAGKYIEIQAGLAQTQLEHIPMGDGAVWTWVEAYGAMSREPGAVHGSWDDAVDAIQGKLDEDFAGSIHDALYPLEAAQVALGALIHTGSGWGALENLRRKADGEPALSDLAFFPEDSITDSQEPWRTLLKTGTFPTADPKAQPGSYIIGNGWYRRLRDCDPRDWYGKMHLGLLAYAQGNVEEAKTCFEASVAAAPSCWSLRNLAMVYRNHLDDPQSAADLMEQAIALEPNDRSLWMDMATTLLKARRYQRLIDLYKTLPEKFRALGRLKLYTANAMIELGQYRNATELLNYDLSIPDFKEGENSVSTLWFRLYGAILAEETGITDPERLEKLVEERYPLKHLDFRMH